MKKKVLIKLLLRQMKLTKTAMKLLMKGYETEADEGTPSSAIHLPNIHDKIEPIALSETLRHYR